MSGPNCHNCIYSVCDPEQWLRLMYFGEPILPRCANHPWFPGQLHEVPGTPCPNYRRRPEPPTGDVRLIPLAEGGYVYVDAADYDWLSQWRWYTTSGGYAARREKNKTIFMHRQIMQPPKGMIVDHVDGMKVNNCRRNLRVCTHQENLRNLRKRNGARSQFKGVCFDSRRGKIYAHCWYEARDHWLGYFDTEREAARGYDRAAVGAFGEFARVNFPREWPPERRAEVHAQAQQAKKKEHKKAKKTGTKERAADSKKGAQTRKRARKTAAKKRPSNGKRGAGSKKRAKGRKSPAG